tara:strand:+ start:1030 stop:1359 length:330 start_codon:yes stop_codon:yes gene_type:complete
MCSNQNVADTVANWMGERIDIITDYVSSQYGANIIGFTSSCNQSDNFKFIYKFTTNTDLIFQLVLHVRHTNAGISISVVSKGKITKDGYTANYNTIDGLGYTNQEPLRF